jgi:hypothetical protein
MRSGLLALGLFSAAAIHPALAAQPAPAPGDLPPCMAMQDAAMQRGPDHGPTAWFGQDGPGPQEPMRQHGQGFGPQGAGMRPMGPPPEFMLAARLSALETRIGVRSEQLDAWRDYTSALQAVLAPPRPGHAPGGPDAKGRDNAPGSRPDALAFQEKLADDVIGRAASAGKLKDAIAALRTTLTPQQLEILASAERPHGPTPGPLGGPPEDAAGPRGLPDDGRQLPPPPPGNGEQP